MDRFHIEDLSDADYADDAVACPICDNEDIVVERCVYRRKVVAYNCKCFICGFTGRSYAKRWKAIKKWNKMCEQCKNIVKE